MKKRIFYIYGIFSYLAFLVVFLYLVGFLANAIVPKSIDSGTTVPAGFAILANIGLIALFGLQHSIMARPGFKKMWTKIVPQPIERSTYVLISTVILAAVMWFWQPMPQTIWHVTYQPATILLWVLFGLGWALLLISTRLINESHLFGLQQVREYLQGKQLSSPEFQTPAFYRFVRHPMMLGFIIAFWATPQMSAGHLIFALATTAYMLIAMRLEERDMIHYFGEKYLAYRDRVPMLFPSLRGQKIVGSAENFYRDSNSSQQTNHKFRRKKQAPREHADR